ncbi:MAG: thiolase domain-containing protein [Actinobacteria bacterium]|nr:MAG: thiolase domain-containing protein [Actinomycetota bacterium]
MREVVIAGVGQTPVGEHWDVSLRSLAARAVSAVRKDAQGLRPEALYIGNLLGSVLSHQANLGALVSGNSGLEGIEACTVEAGEASGAGAMRMGYLAVASGMVDTALVLGVEKYTDAVGPQTEAAVSQVMDMDYEGMQGLTPNGLAGLVAQRYLHETGAPRNALMPFALIAHENGAGNPNAMYRKAIKPAAYQDAEAVADPLNLFDIAPYADGAAAVLLTTPEKLSAAQRERAVRVTGSGVSIDTLALHDRHEPLAFEAVRRAVDAACKQAGLLPGEMDLFETWDSASIYALLTLEAVGLAPRGEGWKLAQAGEFNLRGRMPILTMGGNKARGFPLGAAGVYQVAEAALQLRGEAGPNQLPGAKRALTLSLGGPASTAIAHVLER